jgi:hypothetical protein
VTEKDIAPEEPRQPKGALACLAAGFEIVAHHPNLTLVPLLLGLFLWLGPRFSLTPQVDRIKHIFVQAMTQEGGTIPTDQLQEIHWGLDDLRQHVNLFALLKPLPLLGFPLLVDDPMVALFHTSVVTPFGPRAESTVHSLPALLGTCMLLGIIGLGLTAIYLRWIGIAVIDDLDLPDVGPEPWTMLWLRLIVLMGVTLAILIPIGGAVLFFIGLLAMVRMVLGQLLFVFAVSVAIFIGLSLIFTVPGIVQQRRGILRSAYDSVILTQSNMTSFVQMATVTLVIAWGLDVVWRLPPPDSWTMIVGIVGHAVISTALTVALFVYYHERLGYLKGLQQLYMKHAEDGAHG